MGLLSDFLNQKRQQEQDVQAQAVVQGLLGQQGTPGQFQLPPEQAGPQILPQGGAGLLADINDPNRQATFAAGLLGNAQLRQTGASLLGGVFSDQGAMDRQKSSNQAAMRRQKLTSQTSLTNSQLQREQQQRQFEETFQQKARIEQLKREQTSRQAMLGKPATGFARVPLPGGGLADVMIPGGEPYQKAQGAAIKTRDSVGLVDGILEQLIGADGFESFGEAAGRIAAQTQMIRDSIREARGFGAPQEAELKLLDEMIPDISKLGARAGFAQKSRIVGVYTELRRELMRSYAMQQQLAGFTDIPELQGELGALPTDVGRRAAERGLTQVPRSAFERGDVARTVPLGPGTPSSLSASSIRRR